MSQVSSLLEVYRLLLCAFLVYILCGPILRAVNGQIVSGQFSVRTYIGRSYCIFIHNAIFLCSTANKVLFDQPDYTNTAQALK